MLNPTGLHTVRRFPALLLCLFFTACVSLSAYAQTQLASGTALYARTVRLAHNSNVANNGKILAAVAAFPSTGAEASIYSSADGKSFAKIGAITDADFAGGLCCGTLFELPSKVGELPAGTLLWSASVGQNSTSQAMQLKIFASQNAGVSWKYLSSCAVGSKVGTTGGGLWEPEFEIASDGALVCIFSDETVAGHSQLLRQLRSYDGLHWQDSQNTVASTVQADRPGMAYVTQLPSGLYLMSYEICGTHSCAAYTRTSVDGWNRGDPTDLGRKATTADGAWFAHAPTNAWSPSAASPNGTILLIGQMLYQKDGTLSAGNGSTIFTNHSADGSGPWETMPAPIAIPTANDNYCPNYSSPLLPATDGQSLLEFASRYDASVCTMYFASGPVLAGLLDPQVRVATDAASLSTAQSLNVTVQLSAASGSVTPVGTVTLSDGNGYTSVPTALVAGKASITIPAAMLKAGTATITASYSGDANYTAATASTQVTVTEAPKAGIALSDGKLNLTAGATSANTVSLLVSPLNGFTGTVSLSAQISSAPTGAAGHMPELSFGNTATVTLDGTYAATALLTVKTTARSAAATAPQKNYIPMLGFFCIVPCCFSGISRSKKQILSLLLLSTMIGGITACGGGSASTPSTVTGTTAGNYVITVTGQAGDLVTNSTVTLNVL